MRSYRYSAAAAAVAVFLGCPSALWAQIPVPPDLGAAAPYAVLGVNPTPILNTVRCVDTGPGIGINGQVGTTFNGGIANVGPCTITGSIDSPVAGGVVTAFNAALAQIDIQNPSCTGVIPTTPTTLGPGVYCSAAGTTLTSVTLTLQGNASDVWIFRVGTGGAGALTLTGSAVNLSGGALACNVFWKTSAATTLTDSVFNGTVLSGAAVTMTRTNWVGRAMASTDVTLTDPIPMTFAGCAAGAQPPGCPATSISPLVASNGSLGNSYSQTFTQVGGTGASSFTVPPGTLPAGLTLSSGGVLSGTPTTAETQTFAIRGADAGGCFAVRSYTVVITSGGTPPAAGCPVITLSPTTIPNGAVGVAYSQTLTAVGAVTAVTFTRTAGGLLPSGLTLSSGGVISGTPTTVIADDFVIRATQTNGCFAELSYAMSILAGVPTLPQTFVIVMFLGLLLIGYAQLRNRARV